jgi:hypothetical protein
MTIHIYTCECGEQFRSSNNAWALEQWHEHRDISTLEQNSGADQDRLFRLHDHREHATLETTDVVQAEVLWSPAQGAW